MTVGVWIWYSEEDFFLSINRFYLGFVDITKVLPIIFPSNNFLY